MQNFSLLIEERATAGARELDAKEPGWHKRIVRPVNMQNTHDCTLAQIFGRYRTGVEILGLSDEETLSFGFRACAKELGNDLGAFARYYKALSEAWERKLANRRT